MSVFESKYGYECYVEFKYIEETCKFFIGKNAFGNGRSNMCYILIHANKTSKSIRGNNIKYLSKQDFVRNTVGF